MNFQSAYLSLLQNLLPVGDAWNREEGSDLTKFLSVSAQPFASVHERALDLLDESLPTTTRELFSEWEKDAGLPDSCTGADDTLQERRAALIQKITAGGGQSPAYFKNVAELLGYTIEITEYRPFTAGIDECGVGARVHYASTVETFITNIARVRFFWKVLVKGPRVTWFRCGQSECGIDPLAKIATAADLECIFRRLKPAHTSLIFAYEEADETILTYLFDPVTLDGEPITV